MSGGLASLYSLAALLRKSGRPVALTSPGAKAAGFAEAAEGGEVLPWEGLRLERGDIWLVPESWPNAISTGVQAGARTLVYAQSWNFLLTTLPQGVRWKQLPVEYLAVSDPVAWFMRTVLELPVLGVLPPVVHPAFFAAGENARRPADRVRVAWMPRKNRALAELMQQIAMASLESGGPAAPQAASGPGGVASEAASLSLYASPRVEWVPIQNMSPEEVAGAFASCHLFLATAFPEGFGLPPLEAMAAGCVPVGFTGFGGWEYMRPADFGTECLPSGRMPPACVPPFPLSEACGGNGLFFADGDVMSAGLGLAGAVRAARAGTPGFLAARAAGRATALRYGRGARQQALEGLWNALAAGAHEHAAGGG